MKVLLITDQQLVSMALRMMLEQERPDVELTWKISSPMGVGACANEGPFDLIIVDLDTMGAKRLQLARKVLYLQRSANVVTITGIPSPDEEAEARNIDVAAYLSKNMPNADLAAALRAQFKP